MSSEQRFIVLKRDVPIQVERSFLLDPNLSLMAKAVSLVLEALSENSPVPSAFSSFDAYTAAKDAHFSMLNGVPHSVWDEIYPQPSEYDAEAEEARERAEWEAEWGQGAPDMGRLL